MIIDTLENLKMYVSLNPRLQIVADFLKSADLDKLEIGRNDIQGDEVYVNVQNLKARKLEDAPFEYHRQMIDVQIPLSAAETYGYIPVQDVPVTEFDEKNDCAVVNSVTSASYVTCRPGMFVIFFPQDAHAPGILEVPEVHKLIFKVRV